MKIVQSNRYVSRVSIPEALNIAQKAVWNN